MPKLAARVGRAGRVSHTRETRQSGGDLDGLVAGQRRHPGAQPVRHLAAGRDDRQPAGARARHEQAIGDELAQIASLSPDFVAGDLGEVGVERYPDDLPRKSADLLEWVWVNTVRPYWAERRKIIEADIVARTTQLGRGGWAQALSDMRPGLRWLGEGRLQINAYENPPREISGAQLLFVPVTPGAGWVAWDEPHRYAVMYPCSGTLAEPARRAAAPETLGALLGPARAAILMLLVTPKSTTQLVALTGQRLGSVGRHLQILRAAGLLERRRVGRSVLYRRSAAGDLLVRIQSGA
jgi:DNA-binding transcriptional ArsR family regulator